MSKKIKAVEDVNGAFIIDTEHMDMKGTIAVFVVPAKKDRFILVETGAGSTLTTVEKHIHEAGYELEQLAGIFVTHIHLDHAGAAGALSQRYDVPVCVHKKGAKHLADPSRLWHSAKQIYGDMMEKLWGEMLPVAQDNLHPLQDEEKIKLAGHKIRVIYTPGHASHHLSLLFDDGTMYTGDAAGAHIRGSSVVRPTLPPPEINVELYKDSLKRMRKHKPDRLLLTHYGLIKKPKEHFQKVEAANQRWAECILEGMNAGEDDAALEQRIATLSLAELEQDGAPASVIARHRVISNDAMTVAGIKRYWHKHHPDKILSLG